MADLTFDAVVVGGGDKGMITALYLAAFGGMSVGVFEGRHELGGAWASDDAPTPGFIGDSHCANTGSRYYLPLVEDFPDFSEKGGKFVDLRMAKSVIMAEDHSCLGIYGKSVDANGERTAKEIARFSKKDAETWLMIYDNYWKPGGLREAGIKDDYNLAIEPGAKSNIEMAVERFLANPRCPVDQEWTKLSFLDGIRRIWESVEMRVLETWALPRMGSLADIPGTAAMALEIPEEAARVNAIGGTHSLAHAVIRMFLEHGGKFFSKSPVAKVLVENGKATGIRLQNGSEIRARKLVVTNVSPRQLCHDIVGPEHFSPEILNKVDHLTNTLSCISWYTWAIHNRVNWKASKFNPDINDSGWVILGWRDDEHMVKECEMIRKGITPKERQVVIWGIPSVYDPLRAPAGKHSVCSEQMMPPANSMTERQWMVFKKKNAEEMMTVMERYSTNMNWDNVIGYNPITPYDIAARSPNFAPEGAFAIIDNLPWQAGRFRPIQEFARHRLPVASLYATGTAWPPSGRGCTCAGYNCYKAIAEDFGLDKPWEKKGRPW